MKEEDLDKCSDPISLLKQFTDARIALGHTGVSVPLQESLAFKMAHAHARDAVYSTLDSKRLQLSLHRLDLPVLQVHSKAAGRNEYLQRPDLGRQIDVPSARVLEAYHEKAAVAIIIADGLSATAVNLHAETLLHLLIPRLKDTGLQLAPLILAAQGRVAIADEIAYHLGAKLSLILIGERPGLSASDSMGAYITYDPKPGLTDDSRNCISNIRPGGLPFELAADKIFYLICEALARKLSGVDLKDNFGLLKE